MKFTLKPVVGQMIFIITLALIFGRFLTMWTGMPFPINMVVSGSMEPSLYRGDIVPWIPSGIESAEVGDAIVFKSHQSLSRAEDKLVVHRVVEIKEIKGETKLVTKGDANNYTDQSGPHLPEPYVSTKNFMGKTISVGSQPIKIPFLGYLWLWSQDAFNSLSAHIGWGKPQSDIHYAIFVPLGGTIGLTLVSMVLWAPKKNKSEKEELDEKIFGPERLSFKRILAYSMIFYVMFLMMAYCFAYDNVSASVGMGEKSEESQLNFGRLKENGTEIDQLPVVNPSLLPVKGVMFARGDITPFLHFENETYLFKIGIGKRISNNITANIPMGTEPGVYNGEVFIYSSPYWLVLPDSFMKSLYERDPMSAVILFDLVSALILAISTALFLLVTSWVLEKYILQRAYLSWSMIKKHPKLYFLYRFFSRIGGGKNKLKSRLGKAFNWLDKDVSWVDFNPNKPVLASFAALAFAPFLVWDIFGNFITLIMIAAFTTGLLAYLMGCRWRGQIMLTAVLSSTWILTIFSIISFTHIFMTNAELLVPIAFTLVVVGIILMLFIILIIPVCLIALLPAYILQAIRRRRKPLTMLRGYDL